MHENINALGLFGLDRAGRTVAVEGEGESIPLQAIADRTVDAMDGREGIDLDVVLVVDQQSLVFRTDLLNSYGLLLYCTPLEQLSVPLGFKPRYLADALEPLADRIGSEQLDRLVMALALCVGIESLVVLEDICGLTPADAETVKLWVADALLQATLHEVEGDSAESLP